MSTIGEAAMPPPQEKTMTTIMPDADRDKKVAKKRRLEQLALREAAYRRRFTLRRIKQFALVLAITNIACSTVYCILTLLLLGAPIWPGDLLCGRPETAAPPTKLDTFKALVCLLLSGLVVVLMGTWVLLKRYGVHFDDMRCRAPL